MTIPNKRLLVIILSIVLLLLTPLIAMQFTDEVKWTAADFLGAGVLLFGTGLMCELVITKIRKPSHRIILCTVILTALLLVWLELAVGIFGTPIAGH